MPMCGRENPDSTIGISAIQSVPEENQFYLILALNQWWWSLHDQRLWNGVHMQCIHTVIIMVRGLTSSTFPLNSLH